MAINTENLFRENLKKYRKARGYTQVKLSVLAGISQDYMSEIERGKASPSLKKIIMLADALNIEVRDLFSK